MPSLVSSGVYCMVPCGKCLHTFNQQTLLTPMADSIQLTFPLSNKLSSNYYKGENSGFSPLNSAVSLLK